MDIKLVPPDALKPSAYNPRKADPERLKLVELSLRKLGWLLPIYADADGEILSGHQRHYVAVERLGAKHLPVAFTKRMPLDRRKALNIAFNRGTNDLKPEDTPADITSALASIDIGAMAAAIPDKTPDSAEFFACTRAKPQPIKPLLTANRGRWISHARNVSRVLADAGIEMPVVARGDGRLVNGVGRLQLAAEQSSATIPVVQVSDAEADFAEAMLNLLSMDFDLHNRYADLLRYNSFRRARGARHQLGNGFLLQIIGSKSAGTFQISNRQHVDAWKKTYGRTILDWGAGNLTDSKLLQSVGVDAVPFEPYRVGSGTDAIDKIESLRVVTRFLERVADGTEFDSIFLASILNSVPFYGDRLHIVTLVASLCSPQTKVHACSASLQATSLRQTTGKGGVDHHSDVTLNFMLGYEPNTQLGDYKNKPKVQKYHTVSEWHDLWANRFEAVSAKLAPANLVYAVCQGPNVSDENIESAIDFEFELPYPDGSRMGMSQQARAAWESRKRVRK